MPVTAKTSYDAVELLASVTTAVAGNGSAVRLPGFNEGVASMTFRLDVTDADTAAGDKLDVYVQTIVDGTNWVDVVRFTQVLGNGSDTLRYYAKIERSTAMTEFENGTGLGAAAARDMLGDVWRARYAVTDAGAASFTFSVYACPM